LIARPPASEPAVSTAQARAARFASTAASVPRRERRRLPDARDQRQRPSQRHAHAAGEFSLGQRLELAQGLESRGPGVEDAARVLAHRDDPAAVGLRGGEVQMRELGHRVADLLVERAFAGLAAVQMRDGDAQGHGRGAGREQFPAIAEHDQQVGRQAREFAREAERPLAESGATAAGASEAGVTVRGDLEAVGS
jgi:hypothetical protein